ncbi:MAG: hypothetical protein IKQ35_03320 [Bacilli bacterium]|nr:hypothetical protein [Bacilli bacterium]
MAIENPGYTPTESDALNKINQQIEMPEGTYDPLADLAPTPQIGDPFPEDYTSQLAITSDFLEKMLGSDGLGETDGYVATYIKKIKDAVNFENLEASNKAAFAGDIRTSITTLETNIKNEIDAYATALRDAIKEIADSIPQRMHTAVQNVADKADTTIDGSAETGAAEQ